MIICPWIHLQHVDVYREPAKKDEEKPEEKEEKKEGEDAEEKKDDETEN